MDRPIASLTAGLLARKGLARKPVLALHDGDAVAAQLARTARATKDKAAFTLRLDAERRLRLRLAAAVSGRSAQQLVTEAIDTMLADMAELEPLARRIAALEGRETA
jgi:predicted DNA-binding protein